MQGKAHKTLYFLVVPKIHLLMNSFCHQHVAINAQFSRAWTAENWRASSVFQTEHWLLHVDDDPPSGKLGHVADDQVQIHSGQSRQILRKWVARLIHWTVGSNNSATLNRICCVHLIHNLATALPNGSNTDLGMSPLCLLFPRIRLT